MIINTPISLGELVDKISILKIKKKNIINKEKNKLIDNELELLEKTLEDNLNHTEIIQNYLNDLISINSKLWKIEDDLREYDHTNNIGRYGIIAILARKRKSL